MFHVSPPSATATGLLLLVSALVILATLSTWNQLQGWGALALRTLLSLLSVGFIAFLVLAFLTFLIIDDDALRVTGIYGRKIPLSEIDTHRIREVDLDAEPNLLPSFKTNGLSLPGYQTGWFRLKEGSRALLFLSDHRHVLYIPVSNDYVLLVSVPEPSKVLAGLQQE